MTQEIYLADPANAAKSGMKAVLWRRGTRWNGTAWVAPSTIASGSWTTGQVTLTQLVTSNSVNTGTWVGDMPAGITTAGLITAVFFETGAIDDTLLGQQEILWDGAAANDGLTTSDLQDTEDAVIRRMNVNRTLSTGGLPGGGSGDQVHTVTVRSGSDQPLTTTVVLSGESEANLSVVVPADDSITRTWAVPYLGIKALFVYSDQPVTIKNQSDVTLFELTADQKFYEWTEDALHELLIEADVTELTFENEGDEDASVKIRCVFTDPG